MCGIAGVYSTALPTDRREDLVAWMLSTQQARGPEGARVVSVGPVSVGFARLTIVGGPGVDQPIESGGYLVATIGEIYNYRELWKKFAGDAVQPGHLSDCSVVPLVVQRAGRRFPEHLDGIFSGVVYDIVRDEVVLFRDHVGAKPMHWSPVDGGVAFASSTVALSRIIGTRFNRVPLRSFLATGYVAGTSTLLAGIHDLPPATLGVVDGRRRRVRLHCWVDVTAADSVSGQTTRSLVEHAVQTETPACGIVHACLSGGIDSTITTLLAARRRPDLTAVTVVYDDAEGDADRQHARQVAAAHRIEHVEVPVGWRDYLDALSRPWAFDQPLGDPNALAFARLCERVSERGGKVLLTGDGADELFCGYDYYRRGVRGRLRSAAVASRFDSMVTHTDREFVRRITGSPAPRIFSPALRRPLARMQLLDLQGWLEANLLEKSDRFGMAYSVEVRVPFLRRAVVAAALSLPDHQKIATVGPGKVMLRNQFADLLPPHVLGRPKQGFFCPLDDWLAGPLGQELEADAGEVVEDGWDPYVEREMWRVHRSGERSWGQQLWRLAVLRAWWRTVGDKVMSPKARR